jgi:hypothetical protein
MGYWQVSAGYGGEKRGGRSYFDVFLDFGVMLIGPGEYGEYCGNDLIYKRKKDGRRVQRFVEEVKNGHKVALKRPAEGNQWEVLAVGVVTGDYEWIPVFDDVEGWDIRHGRRVEWREPADGPKTMSGFTRGTLSKVKKTEIKREIGRIWEAGKARKSKNIPSPAKTLSDQDLVNIIKRDGLSAEKAEETVRTIERITELAEWYREKVREGIKVKEHETRTFLIVPLLLALGWPERHLKIEWHNIDIAFFDEPYSEDTDQCVMILESKKLLESLATKAEKQVTGYSSRCPNCQRLVVSDGCSYKLFDKGDGDEWRPSAYLNILKPRVSHPYRETIGGASEVLTSLVSR